jgi:hypothetical protein
VSTRERAEKSRAEKRRVEQRREEQKISPFKQNMESREQQSTS